MPHIPRFPIPLQCVILLIAALLAGCVTQPKKPTPAPPSPPPIKRAAIAESAPAFLGPPAPLKVYWDDDGTSRYVLSASDDLVSWLVIEDGARSPWPFVALSDRRFYRAIKSTRGKMLEWDANPEANLAGYKVYGGINSGQYLHVVDVGLQTDFSITNSLALSDNYFAVTAYNVDGEESDFSKEVNSEIVGTNLVRIGP